MAMVNIPSTCEDPAYRYKMPRLVTTNQSRGNGKQTRIVNMSEVARALKRPPQYIMKWFGTELCAASEYTDKAGEGERAIVKGHIEAQQFQKSLDGFIEKYVCCAVCHLPEIIIAVRKGSVVGRCLACGWAGHLDNNHKLGSFILKNPPDENGHRIILPAGAEGNNDKKSRREAKARKQSEAKHRGDDGDSASFEDSASVEDEEKIRKEKKDKKEKKDSKEKIVKKDKNVNNTAGSIDYSEDAEATEKKDNMDKKERKNKKLTQDEQIGKGNKNKNGRNNTVNSETLEKNLERKCKQQSCAENFEYNDPEVKDIIRKVAGFFNQNDGSPSVEDFFDRVRMEQVAQGFDARVRLYIVLEATCGTTMDASAIIKQKKHVDKFIKSAKMQTEDVLWVFGAYYAQNQSLVKNLAMVLKASYDEDWLQEESIVAYYEDADNEAHPGYEEARKASAPFITWLKTVESEDEDEDDDDNSY